MRLPTLVLVVVFGLVAGGALALGALFAALNSPALLRGLAGVFGHEVSAQALSVSPRLSGSISGLTLRIGKGQQGETDLSFLERLPNVRQLDVQDAQAVVTFAEGPQRVELTRANLSVRNDSSRTGGRVTFRTDFAVTTGGDRAVAATGARRPLPSPRCAA